MSALQSESSVAAQALGRASTTVQGRLGRGLLIHIHNGGTLTDFCVIDGDEVHRDRGMGM